MSSPLRELPGHQTIKAMHQLEWRYQTLQEEFEEAMSYEDPSIGEHERTFHFSRRDELYEAEKLLHHYLAGYYTYWRQVMTVGHATNDGECRGRIKNEREKHDEQPNARIARGLRMYVQKENVLPILLYQSKHDDTAPKWAISKDDVYRDGLYDPDFEHYFGSVDGQIIFPYEVIEKNWGTVESLHESVKDLVFTHMEDELEEYKERLQTMDEMSQEIPIPPIIDEFLSTADPFSDDAFR